MENLASKRRIKLWLLLLVPLASVLIFQLLHRPPLPETEDTGEFGWFGGFKQSDLGFVGLVTPNESYVNTDQLKLTAVLSPKSASEQVVWRIWNEEGIELWGVVDSFKQERWTLRDIDTWISLKYAGERLPGGDYQFAMYPKTSTAEKEDYVQTTFTIGPVGSEPPEEQALIDAQSSDDE